MDVFSICEFKTDENAAVEGLRTILSAGMPPDVRLRMIREDLEPDEDPEAGLLHVIASNAPSDKQRLAQELAETVLNYGGSWLLLDGKGLTPGCICLKRNLKHLYRVFVLAGARAEVFKHALFPSLSNGSEDVELTLQGSQPPSKTTAGDQMTYLVSQVSYEEDKLLTEENDAVMMEWERPIMKRSAEVIASSGARVLNVGFGMGIIDSFLQGLDVEQHYIIEAHPAVLQAMREKGWGDKPNVTILEGTWRKCLPLVREAGIKFDGIYYDTFSEHYRDLKEFFSFVVDILNPDGVFSFFNGLGADRQIVYDVYKEVVEVELKQLGLQVQYEEIDVNISDALWKNIKHSYFKLKKYALPVVTFSAHR